MQKFKRILALLGVILLVGLYVATFLAAIFDNPNSFTFFKVAFGATIAIPTLLWIIGIFLRISKKKDDPSTSDDGPDK